MSEEGQRKRPPTTVYYLSSAFECFVLAEILYYYLHNGDSTLHDEIAERTQTARKWIRERLSIWRVRRMIRDLPET